MNKLRTNITAVILALGMLTSGNFAYVILHGECITEESTHHKCEMECCQESDCCEGEDNAVEIKNGDNCCEVHVETSQEQNYPLPPLNKTPEKQKIDVIKLNLSSANFDSQYQVLTTHKLKTTNIFLELSNLRI